MFATASAAHMPPAASDKGSFWDMIFTVLGPFDIFNGTARDPLLRSRRELLVQIFRLVDYPENLAVSVAALHVISDICESPAFEPAQAGGASAAPHRVYAILEAAGALPGVMSAFVRRLEREEAEQARIEEDTVVHDEAFMASFGLANLVRLQILDFLIRNAAKPGYNLAHFLLGYTAEAVLSGANVLPAPPAADAPAENAHFTALHVVVELLQYGLGQPSTPIVALDHPSLGERCYKLLSVLLASPSTRRPLAAYLRGPEDALLPRSVALISCQPVDTSDASYTRFECYQKAHLFTAAAHDLHLAAADGRSWPHVSRALHLFAGIAHDEKASKDSLSSDERSPLVKHIASLEALLTTPVGRQDAIADAACEAISAAGSLCRIALSPALAPPTASNAASGVPRAQTALAALLVPLVGRILVSQDMPAAAVEAAAAVSLAALPVVASLNESNALSGDECRLLVDAAHTAILRPAALGPMARACCYALALGASAALGSAASAVERVDKRDALRIVEIAGSDATMPGEETADWRALAMTFVSEMFASETLSQTLVDRLARLGILRAVVADMRGDDEAMTGAMSAPRVAILWAARTALLCRVAACAGGVERLLEAGLSDVLCSLRMLCDDSGVPPPHAVAAPIVRLARLMATDGHAGVSAVAAFAQTAGGQRLLAGSVEALVRELHGSSLDTATDAACAVVSLAEAFPSALFGPGASLAPSVGRGLESMLARLLTDIQMDAISLPSADIIDSQHSMHTAELILSAASLASTRMAAQPAFPGVVGDGTTDGALSARLVGQMLVWSAVHLGHVTKANEQSSIALSAVVEVVSLIRDAASRSARRFELQQKADGHPSGGTPPALLSEPAAFAALSFIDEILSSRTISLGEDAARACAGTLRAIGELRAGAEASGDATNASASVFQ